MKELYELEIDGSADPSNSNSSMEKVRKTLEDAGFKYRLRFKSNLSFEEQASHDLWESHMAAG
jgi:hypothetical protein